MRRAKWGQIKLTFPAGKVALRSVSKRHVDLTAEIKALDTQLAKLIPKAAPTPSHRPPHECRYRIDGDLTNTFVLR